MDFPYFNFFVNILSIFDNTKPIVIFLKFNRKNRHVERSEAERDISSQKIIQSSNFFYL